MVFYGVAGGPLAGIYDNWNKAENASRGHKGPKVKKFKSKDEAATFVEQSQPSPVITTAVGSWVRPIRNLDGGRNASRSARSSPFVPEARKCGLCAGSEATSRAQGPTLHIMLLLKPRNLTNHQIC